MNGLELLDRYEKQLNKDCKLDDFNIREVQQRLPARKHWWVGQLVRRKIERSDLIEKKKRVKMEVVAGVIAGSPTNISASVAANKAENHESIIKINKEIRNLDFVIEYLEKADKVVNSMGWDIKNIISLNQLEQL